MSAEFVDTNILVYAYESAAGDKHRTALTLVRDLWDSSRGVVSTQVLQEFYVTVTRKIAKPLKPSIARELLHRYRHWRIVLLSLDLILKAADTSETHKISFWDGLIVAAALSAEASILWTEDLHSGQKFGSLIVRNPFA